MKYLFSNYNRSWALIVKELRQIKHNRRLVISLIIPPILQVILFGFALNPDVKNLPLGIVDECQCPASRELISQFVESHVFQISSYYRSPQELSRAIEHGDITAGMILPVDLDKKLAGNQSSSVQLIFDGVNSNTATIAGNYSLAIITAHNRAITINENRITVRNNLLFNPGLRYPWYIVTGIFGMLIILNGSIVSAAAMIKEKESGTIEQLIISPARSGEILLAKFAPLFLLLMLQSLLSLAIGCLVFDIPIRGSLLLLLTGFALSVLISVGIGAVIATITENQQQAQLMSIFVIPPIAMLSGAMTPLEAMPHWLQKLTYINPARHFAEISRGIMLKGIGLEILWINFGVLLCIAVSFVIISSWRLKKQLG